MQKATGKSSPKRVTSSPDVRPKVKRTRIALACARCRTRKQKCDGAQPVCSTCKRLGLCCQFKPHSAPKPDQKRMYIAALENHVAALEQLLSESGYDQVTVDHWKEMRHQIKSKSYATDDSPVEDFNSLPATTGDPIWNAMMNFYPDGMELRISGLFDPPSPEMPKDVGGMAAKLMQQTPPDIASRLIDGWIEHLSTQFPIVHTPHIRQLHEKPVSELDNFEASLLLLIYANTGRILEAIGEIGQFQGEDYYKAAAQNMDIILALRDVRSVQYLSLLALYCLRDPRNSGAWTLAGLAVRQCIELGLHRKIASIEAVLEHELNIRLFWVCYYLDRGVSVALGRPPAISDSDIDVELPLDIDEDVEDVRIVQQAIDDRMRSAAHLPSTLTPFIHLLRLRTIEAEIEHVIYRLHRKSHAAPAVIQGFLQRLAEWKAAIPEQSRNGDTYTLPYCKCVRLLLYSQLSKVDVNFDYLNMCADACANLCSAYKRLNRMNKVDSSPLALQSLFICGITLLYCVWLAPLGSLDVMGAISDCNLMLYIMDERSPSARKYRDVFERVKMNVIDDLERGAEYKDRETGVLDAEITDRCRSLENGLLDTVRTDYEQIITDLAKKTDRLNLDMLHTQDDLDDTGINELHLKPTCSASLHWDIIPSDLMNFDIQGDESINIGLHDFDGLGNVFRPT